MSLREIPARQWEEFLEEFSRGHRAWLATVELSRREFPRDVHHVQAVERPLQEIAAEVREGRVAWIEIRFQKDTRGRETVRIQAPATIRVDQTDEGTDRGLEVIDDNGDCTRIQFRAAPRPEMLDGIAPGEVIPE